MDIPAQGIDLDEVVNTLEKNLLIKALDRSKGVKKKAAELLNISFRSFRYRLEKHDMDEAGEEE
jgi:two-component system response regulator PilR (NtrC family)